MHALAQGAAHGCDALDDAGVGVRLEGARILDAHGTHATDTGEVVAHEIDDHAQLGPVLEAVLKFLARPCRALHGSGQAAPARGVQAEEEFGAERADDAIGQFEVDAERRACTGGQRVEQGACRAGEAGDELVGKVDLENVAGVDEFDGGAHARLVPAAPLSARQGRNRELGRTLAAGRAGGHRSEGQEARAGGRGRARTRRGFQGVGELVVQEADRRSAGQMVYGALLIGIEGHGGQEGSIERFPCPGKMPVGRSPQAADRPLRGVSGVQRRADGVSLWWHRWTGQA